jgi:hypothetical protein
MATDDRSIVATNLVAGLCVTAVGTALVLDRLQLIDARQFFRFWPVAVILFGASMVIESLRGGDLTDDRAGRRRHSGPGFFVIVFLIIVVSQTLQRGRGPMPADANDTMSLTAVMAVDQRIATATRFRHAEMTSIMGQCRLDLRSATLAPGEEAIIDVFTLMGGLVITAPEGWTVDVQTVPIMGGVNNRRQRPASAEVPAEREPPAADGAAERAPSSGASEQAPSSGAAAPRVIVRGFIMMGGLTVR